MRHNRGAVSVGELVKVNMGMGCLKKEGFFETWLSDGTFLETYG